MQPRLMHAVKATNKQTDARIVICRRVPTSPRFDFQHLGYLVLYALYLLYYMTLLAKKLEWKYKKIKEEKAVGGRLEAAKAN